MNQKNYIIIIVILLLIILAFGIYTLNRDDKDTRDFENEGTIIFPANILNIENLNCGAGFRIDGSSDAKDYEELGLNGNFITLCDTNLNSDQQFNINQRVLVKGKLYKTEGGQGYIIIDSIETLD